MDISGSRSGWKIGTFGAKLAACTAIGPACIPILVGVGAIGLGVGGLGYLENSQQIKDLNTFSIKLQEMESYLDKERKNMIDLEDGVHAFVGELKHVESMTNKLEDKQEHKLDISKKDKTAIDFFITDAITAGEETVKRIRKTANSIIAKHSDTTKIE